MHVVKRYLGGAMASEHFSLWELVRSNEHPDLVYIPSPRILQHLELFAGAVLEPARKVAKSRLKIDSGLRMSALNKEVGGVLDSVHQIYYRKVYIGVGADLVPLDTSLSNLVNALLVTRSPAVRGIIVYPKRGFVHVDTAVKRAPGCVIYVSTTKGKYEVIGNETSVGIGDSLRSRFDV